MDTILTHEALVRLTAFFGVFFLMTAWEAAGQRRDRVLSRLKRWPGNLQLSVLNTVLVRLVLPAGLTGLAVVIQAQGFGLMPLLGAPLPVAIIVCVLALDLVVYAQHVVFHAVPALWRLHRVHHADLDLDVTTALRFHPAEIGISLVIKAAAVALLGAPPEAVILFEILLNATAMFNHSNVAIPAPIERPLRAVLVTPDMHRVHHSQRPEETNSNYGFNLSLWDRVFRTYRAEPQDGHADMKLGLAEYGGLGPTRLGWMLANPWADTRPPVDPTPP